jgi:hypothetical protein
MSDMNDKWKGFAVGQVLSNIEDSSLSPVQLYDRLHECDTDEEIEEVLSANNVSVCEPLEDDPLTDVVGKMNEIYSAAQYTANAKPADDAPTNEKIALIKHLMEQIDSVWSTVPRDQQNEINDIHNENYSLGHCIRWGGQALEEIERKLTQDNEQTASPDI